MDETLSPSPLIGDDEEFLRMNRAERFQHILLIATFTILILTGLPLILTNLKILRSVFAAEKAFYFRGLLHRVAAVLMIVNIFWHAGYSMFTKRGRSNFKEMMPKLKDVRDAFEVFGHNIGLTAFLHRHGVLKAFFDRHPYLLFLKEPEFGRYNFIEKFEYLGVAWGSLVMIVSGFFMWQVELSLKLFPLWVHDIFIIVHGYEAILAFLTIIIWHMYNVHLNPEVFPMSKVWLNGKITGHELRMLHPLEYRQIAAEREREAAAQGKPRKPIV
jgi:cytochrome b subunit of formate dehydrogenase